MFGSCSNDLAAPPSGYLSSDFPRWQTKATYDPQTSKKPATDSKREAPRQLLLWIIPLAVAAIGVLLLGVHFTGGIK